MPRQFCATCGAVSSGNGGKCPNDATPLQVCEGLLGSTIGNHTMIRRIGSGGMGEVYEAIQPHIGARFAIKVLNADAQDAASARRFLIEAQAVNRIQHDGVVKILDAGYLSGGRPYLMMEFLDGASLAEVMNARTDATARLPMGSAGKIVSDVLGVLSAAHAEGIVHRDLKPHNVFLTRSGRTVVLDFGVAKLLDPAAAVSLTLTGAIVGTPAYMAPEQIQDEPVDGRSDLYSIGVVLYELMTGRRPFDGAATYDLLTAHVERRPPPARAIRPDVPESIQAVLMSALAKRPDDRFQTADAMRAALLQALSGLPPDAFAAIELPPRRKRQISIPPGGGLEPVPTEVSPPRKLPALVVGDPVDDVADTVPEGRPAALATVAHRKPATRARAPEPDAGDTHDEVARTLAPVRRRRRWMIAIGLGLAGVAVAAFAIGKQFGRGGSSSKPIDGSAASLFDAAGAGSGSGSVAGALDAATGIDVRPIAIPKEIDRALLAAKLTLDDLPTNLMSDVVRGGSAMSPHDMQHVLIGIRGMRIDRDFVDKKFTRVGARLRAAETDSDPATVAAAAKARGWYDAAAGRIDERSWLDANRDLFNAEWWLVRKNEPP
jgi:hypothetical protein